MISAEQFKQELRAQLDHAAARGYPRIVINALELHVALGVFPAPDTIPLRTSWNPSEHSAMCCLSKRVSAQA
jgi:hypothetical protein